MLSNAYFLAKFRFDTVENEPAKNLQNFMKFKFCKILENLINPESLRPRCELELGELGRPAQRRTSAPARFEHPNVDSALSSEVQEVVHR